MLDESVDMLPAALRPREFKVGDRVRVLARPECHYCRDFEGETGHTGVVKEIAIPTPLSDPTPSALAHTYWVTFDSLPQTTMSTWMAEFAAAELEPIGDES